MLPEFNSNCNPGTNAAKVPKWWTSAVSTRWWHSVRAVWRIWLLMIITVTKQKGHRQHAFWVTSERRNPAPCIWKHHFYNAIEHEHHFNAERTATKKSESTWTLLRIWQCHGDVCCCLTHSMDGKIFASRQKKKRETSMSADGNGRVDSRMLKRLGDQTTHRAWVAKPSNLIGPL